MKLSELVEKTKKQVPFYKCGIEIKKYINMSDKEIIIKGFQEIDGLVDEVIEEDKGTYSVNYFLLDSLYATTIITNYTNIELDVLEDFENEDGSYVDLIIKYGILEYVENEIDENELNNFKRLMKLTLDQRINNLNSNRILINNIVSQIKEIIPSDTKIKNMVKKAENFDSNKLKIIKDLYNYTKKE